MARRHQLVFQVPDVFRTPFISLRSVQPTCHNVGLTVYPLDAQSQRHFCGLSFNQIFMPVLR
jgi:hypothetical protein